MIRGVKLNRELLAPLIDKDPELKATMNQVAPILETAVDEVIDRYEASIADTIKAFMDDAQDNSALRATFDAAMADAEKQIDDMDAKLSQLGGMMAELQTMATAIEATMLSDQAADIVDQSNKIRTDIEGFRQGVRSSAKLAVSAGFKALGISL